MEKRNAFFVTVLAGMLAAVPALGAGDACIQVNRIYIPRKSSTPRSVHGEASWQDWSWQASRCARR
jgi:hypothetical protein